MQASSQETGPNLASPAQAPLGLSKPYASWGGHAGHVPFGLAWKLHSDRPWSPAPTTVASSPQHLARLLHDLGAPAPTVVYSPHYASPVPRSK